MKGTIEEMFYLVVIVFAILMLFVFFTYQRGTRGAEVRKTVEERLLSEEIATAISTIFNNKLPFVEKTYLQTGIDAILLGASLKKEKYRVFYGIGIGELNLTEIIPAQLENYVKGRWELKIITPDDEYTYGGLKKGEIIYSYEALIPVPHERVGKLIFLLGKP